MNEDAIVMKDEIDEESSAYQVFVVNIKWNTKNKVKTVRRKEFTGTLPESIVLDIPENVLAQANKKNNVFNDVIESFVYKILSYKFGYEMWWGQIWLPLDK